MINEKRGYKMSILEAKNLVKVYGQGENAVHILVVHHAEYDVQLSADGLLQLLADILPATDVVASITDDLRLLAYYLPASHKAC